MLQFCPSIGFRQVVSFTLVEQLPQLEVETSYSSKDEHTSVAEFQVKLIPLEVWFAVMILGGCGTAWKKASNENNRMFGTAQMCVCL